MSNVKTETLQLTSPYGGEPAIFNFHVDVKIPVSLLYSCQILVDSNGI